MRWIVVGVAVVGWVLLVRRAMAELDYEMARFPRAGEVDVMAIRDYPDALLVDIKIRAARIAQLDMDELARLKRADPATVNALGDGLRLACDELDVQADIERSRQ